MLCGIIVYFDWFLFSLLCAAAKSVGPRMQASEAVPFLSKPPRLDSSIPGYAGFDPLRISDAFDVNYLRVRTNNDEILSSQSSLILLMLV